MTNDNEFDLFFCYVSEDKDYAASLVEALRELGASVWWDRCEIKVGDSLVEAVNRGLSMSRFGAVIVSQNFLDKGAWAKYELNGLIAKEVNGGNPLLPIWLDVTNTHILAFNPGLAHKRAIIAHNSNRYAIADEIIEVIRPDLHTKIHRREAYLRQPSAIRTQVTTDLIKRVGRFAPMRHSSLPYPLMMRIRLIRAAIFEVYPMSYDAWVDGFRRDSHPTREIELWEKLSAAYLEHNMQFACTPEEQKEVFNLLLYALSSGDGFYSLNSKDFKLPIEQFSHLQHRWASSPVGESLSDNPFREGSHPDDLIEEKIGRFDVESFEHQFDNNAVLMIQSDLLLKQSKRVYFADVSEIGKPEIRELMKVSGAILGVDKKTGCKNVFYGRETLTGFSKRPTNDSFPLPIIIFSYDNSSLELEKLFAAVTVLKGYCCYKPTHSIPTRNKSRKRNKRK